MINTKHALKNIFDYGNITVRFADRCYEYSDSGILIKATSLKTVRVESVALDEGRLPVTVQVFDLEKDNFIVNEFIFLN
jgi:hypothetical protein